MTSSVQIPGSALRASIHAIPTRAPQRGSEQGHPLAFLTPEDWQILRAHAESRRFVPGERLLQQDLAGQGLLILTKGTARVVRNVEGDEIMLAVLGPGEICGEMAFLESSACSASVVAECNAEAFSVGDAQLQELFQSHPQLGLRFYRSVALTLSRRLRRTSGQMSQNLARGLAKSFGELLLWGAHT